LSASPNYITGADRAQAVLFPEVIDDYIAPDNPVRLLDAFVGRLDLLTLGFTHAQTAATGRPPYDPGDLLRLYIYGYLNRLRSSRRLEVEAQRNLELVWLLRRLRPDFKTIADFRRDNGPALKQVCREFTLLCKKLDLFGGELVAIDGSKFRAQNGKDRNYSAAKLRALIGDIDAKVAAYLTELETQDQTEAAGPPRPSATDLQEKIAALKQRGVRYQGHLARLEQSGESQVSLTDPDARLMSQGAGAVVGYNVQAAVDAKHRLIVDTEVTNTSSDLGQLGNMAMQAQETLAAPDLSVVADKGYYSGKEILICDSVGISAYVAKPLTSANTARGLYGKEKFIYDANKDVYICPARQELTYRFSTHEKQRPIRYYRASVCRGCPLRGQCTRNQANRTITRLAFEEIQEAMAARVAAHPEIMRARKGIIEHCFGTLKRGWGFDHFLCRGLKKVQVEMSLATLAYNFKRALNILGLPAILAALG
jgi:transposase